MTPVSHALLPVFFGRRWIPRNDGVPSLRITAVVALCGALPDVLSPHLSLDARHAAASHTLWAWTLFSGLIFVLHKTMPPAFPRPVAVLCSLAYMGHILCDLITGGVALLYPFSTSVQGKNHLPYWLWIACDGSLILYVYLAYRWLPLRKRIRERMTRPPTMTMAV